MVTIANFSFPHEAHLARARLEAEGIPAVVADEHTVTMNWLYSNAIGGVKVRVPEEFADKAREVLSKDFSKELVADRGADYIKCPECGSTDTEFIVRGRRFAFIVFLALMFPLWPFRRQIKCKSCGVVSGYKRK